MSEIWLNYSCIVGCRCLSRESDVVTYKILSEILWIAIVMIYQVTVRNKISFDGPSMRSDDLISTFLGHVHTTGSVYTSERKKCRDDRIEMESLPVMTKSLDDDDDVSRWWRWQCLTIWQCLSISSAFFPKFRSGVAGNRCSLFNFRRVKTAYWVWPRFGRWFFQNVNGLDGVRRDDTIVYVGRDSAIRVDVGASRLFATKINERSFQDLNKWSSRN